MSKQNVCGVSDYFCLVLRIVKFVESSGTEQISQLQRQRAENQK